MTLPRPCWVVTGGAGYIGAHVVARLQRSGLEAVVIDDLSTGDRSRLSEDVSLSTISLLDTDAVEALLAAVRPAGVIHLAARKSHSESLADPLRYAHQNVGGLISLLTAMERVGLDNLVFSSSSAVYGEMSQGGAVPEDAPLDPTTPYGESKRVGERLIEDLCAAGRLRAVSLRYFNVIGAASPRLIDLSGDALLPAIVRAVRDGRPIPVFGTDYPTPDGSCVRDFIDVRDLADAHLAAAAAVTCGPRHRVYNVGRGVGVSVLQMIAVASEVLGTPIQHSVLPRRDGDLASVLADVRRIRAELGWSATRDVASSLQSVWTSS